ncbi:MAG: hypothetical protein GXO91_03205 [FCB group bacterium]|nr:hypothetical protein [FCB group bacterium]
MSLSRLQPIQNSSADIEEHAGDVSVASAAIFGMYGVTDKVNLILSVPYKRWHQYNVEHEDSHHRNETISGFGDLSLGIRTILENSRVGPGHRVYLDIRVFLPTAPSYKINPFTVSADEIPHEHFALGTGQYSAALGFEYWVRGEFPWILGISTQLKTPLNTSDIGYKPGQSYREELHLIRQKPFFKSFFPYFKISMRQEVSDIWDEEKAPNSGGKFLDGFAQLNLELNESSSLILSVGVPLWQSVSGSQLNGLNGSVSYRITIN